MHALGTAPNIDGGGRRQPADGHGRLPQRLRGGEAPDAAAHAIGAAFEGAEDGGGAPGVGGHLEDQAGIGLETVEIRAGHRDEPRAIAMERDERAQRVGAGIPRPVRLGIPHLPATERGKLGPRQLPGGIAIDRMGQDRKSTVPRGCRRYGADLPVPDERADAVAEDVTKSGVALALDSRHHRTPVASVSASHRATKAAMISSVSVRLCSLISTKSSRRLVARATISSRSWQPS